jgi:hypothetical protein
MNVIIKNLIFGYHISYKAEPFFNNYWIFVLSPLVVVLAIEFGFDLWTTLNEVCCPIFADRRRVAFRKKKISYILYISRPGRKFT